MKYEIERSVYGTWTVISMCKSNGRNIEFETTNLTKAQGVKEFLTQKLQERVKS